MKLIKNFVFILSFLYFANTVLNAVSNKKFYLDKDDILRLPIEEFLDYDQNISHLSYQTESQVEVVIPKIESHVDYNIDDQSGLNPQDTIDVVASASYENFTAKLYKDV